MNVREVLERYVKAWDQISPRMYVSEIVRASAVSGREDSELEWLARLLPVLLPNDPDQRLSFDPYSLLDAETPSISEIEILCQRLRERAETALADESIGVDLLADGLEELAVAQLTLRFGGGPDGLRGSRSEAVDGSVDGEIFSATADLLGFGDDPMGVMSWWVSPNSWLGESPISAARRGRDAEVVSAARQVFEDSW